MEDVRRQVNEAVQSRHVSILLPLFNMLDLFLDYIFWILCKPEICITHAILAHLALVDFGIVVIVIFPSSA